MLYAHKYIMCTCGQRVVTLSPTNSLYQGTCGKQLYSGKTTVHMVNKNALRVANSPEFP
jgi:hypothetical protein